MGDVHNFQKVTLRLFQALPINRGTEDARKILSNDAACPICDQALSKRQVLRLHYLMKPVDINPSDEWINMANSGISPQICILTVCSLCFMCASR
nr:E3 ubiquitin-protein ligase CCNB1IP1 homolog isoform X1 [Ipomoea batatas]